jgi:endonuclease/exonuclease/phosphatase family metal-dependent hydrolase
MRLLLISAAIAANFAVLSAARDRSNIRRTTSTPREFFDHPRQIQITSPNGSLRSIRVMTWNIDRGTELNAITQDLRKNPADLCLLQEVDWGTARTQGADIAAELANRLHLNAAYGIEFEELGQECSGSAYIGQATLTELPIVRVRVLRFQHQSGWWQPRTWMPSSLSLMQRRIGGRIALVTDLEFAGRLLVVYNAHLESRSFGKIQSEQLDEILADAKQYSPATPILIGGDLNTKYFPSKFLKKLQGAGFRSALGERIERTHKIAMSLDWIFAAGPVKLQDGVVRRDLTASDHYPLYAELVAY